MLVKKLTNNTSLRLLVYSLNKKLDKIKEILMRSIKTRLILYFTLLLIVSSSIVGIISLRSSARAIRQEAEKALKTLSLEDARLTESRMETQQKTLEMMAIDENIQSMEWSNQKPYIEKMVKEMGFLALAVVDTKGIARYPDETTSDLSQRDYVQNALSGTANISDVIISTVTGEPVVMIASPIYKNNQLVGALVARSDGNALSTLVEDTGYGTDGYGYIINKSGTVIAHPDREKVLSLYNPLEEVKKDKSLSSLAKVFETILAKESGVDAYTYNGNKLYVGYAPIKGTEWIFVIAANASEVLEELPALQLKIILVVSGIIVASAAIVYFIGSSITKPIIHTAKQSQKLAKLDITGSMEAKYLNRKDEIGILATSLQEITTNLSQIVGNISDSSELLAAASQQLKTSALQSASTAGEAASAVEEIAIGASDQAKHTEEGCEKAGQLGGVIEKNQFHLKELNEANEKVAKVLVEGLHKVGVMTQKTEENNKASLLIQQAMEKTKESSNKISQASITISAIAEQTNLLALNAAIEAARAGEAGKGFSVVAEEIRRLAEQSSEATKEIDSMVNELQDNAFAAVHTIEEMSQAMKEQTESVEGSKKSYLSIEESIQEADSAVRLLNVSGDEMETMKNSILNIMENLSAIAEENSASTEEVSASLEEQAASMDEITSASEGLAQMAQKLQVIVGKFSLSSET